MAELNELMGRLQKAIEGLDEDPGMSPEEFVEWATSEIEKAQKDPAEVRKARITHLKEQVAAVVKNYEGVTPGAIAVEQFKDPGQQVTTSEEIAAVNPPASPANWGTETPEAQQGAGNTPPGGTMPASDSAPSSGFATPEAATFAKALEEVNKKLDAIMGNEDPNAAESKSDTETETENTEPVKKSVGVLWPHDMNTAFGLQEKDAPEIPEWGYDAGSEAERMLKATEEEKAAKEQSAAK